MDPDALLLLVLGLAGLLVGATGTWSPCGFSMIETIGPTGHTGGLATTLAASATFAPAAVLGGAITYGLLGWFGEVLLGAGGTVAYAAAAVVALAAAVAEARGTPIVPRVRRQLPVGWRRSAPMPLASAGYGVLLGLGFTTFVLSYGVWALMGVSLALGDPVAGLVIGVAFGLGRALPIVVLAPLADRPSGERACEAMAMRPGLLRGARAGDAVALLAVATVLLGGAGAADAARKEVNGGSDPSVSGKVLAFELGGSKAILQQGAKRTQIPGTDPAVGGPYAAVIREGRVEVLDPASGESRGSVAAAGADGLAISKRWLAVRRRDGRRDVLSVAPMTRSGAVGKLRRFATSAPNSQFSRPGLSGSTLVYAYSKRSRSSLLRAQLGKGGAAAKARRLRSSKKFAFTGPSVLGSATAYVETSKRRQTVRVTKGGGKGNVVLRRRSGPPTLWTTAIGKQRVYVTVVARGGAGTLVSVNR